MGGGSHSGKISRERAIRKIGKTLGKAIPGHPSLGERLQVQSWRDSLLLTGRVDQWEEKVKAGYIAAAFSGTGKPFTGTINDIEVVGLDEEKDPLLPSLTDSLIGGRSFDVLIIGGGVIGAAVAQSLAKFNLSIALVEKESDLATHASGRNDGMVHPGFAATPGSLKAELNIQGNRMYDQLCRDLSIPFRRPGSMILFPSRIYRLLVPVLKRRAKKNGVEGYRYLKKQEVAEMEPWFTKKQRGAFFLPSAGVLSPYKLVLALAGHAVENGVEVFTDCAVTGFEMGRAPSLSESNPIRMVKTNRGNCRARVVINAAGIWSDWIANLADDRFFSLHGRKGVDAILDINTGSFQSRIAGMPHLFRERHSRTKGGGLVPTIEGNILVGPTAKEVPFRENYETDREDLEDLFSRLSVNKKLHPGQVITYFAGIRACTWEEDFIIRRSDRAPNLIHLAGIQSPGLASAPAIAQRTSTLVTECLGELSRQPVYRAAYKPRRTAPPIPTELSETDRDELIRRDPAYGRIVCRCEGISEGEIRDAVKGAIPALSLDGIKRRTRGGTGRCHGGFCTPRIMEIISRESGLPMEEITKKGGESRILFEETKRG